MPSKAYIRAKALQDAFFLACDPREPSFLAAYYDLRNWIRTIVLIAVFVASPGWAAIPRNPVAIASVDDMRTNLRWLESKYREARSVGEFDQAVVRLAKLIAECEATTPKYITKESNDPTSTTRKWMETNRMEWQAIQKWTNNNPKFANDANESPSRNVQSRTQKLRTEVAEWLVEYAKRGDVLPECRAVLVQRVGAALPANEFADFRDLVLFELTRIVWRERAENGYVIRPLETQREKIILEKIVGTGQTSSAPSEMFASLALGLYEAAQKHGIEEANRVRLQLRILTQLAPLHDNGQPTTILRLAFGQDPPQTTLDDGFFRFLMPADTTGQNLADAALICMGECRRNRDNKAIFGYFSDQLAAVFARLAEIDKRLAVLETRMTELEARVSHLEQEVKRLWEALRETEEFVVEYVDFRKNPSAAKFRPFPASELSDDQQDALLRRVAPILLTDKGDATTPQESTSETIVSPQWLVAHCGIFTNNPAPFPLRKAPFIPAFGGVDYKNFGKLITLVDGISFDFKNNHGLYINSYQDSDYRDGPMGKGQKAASLEDAIKKGQGVFGLVQKVGKTMYSVQYYVCFPYNAARIQEIPFVGYWNHGGDWLCIDLTVRLLAKDVENPIIVLGYLHNHGPVIEVAPSAMELEDLHLKVYLEWGCNEPQPRAGGQGDRHTDIPGIRRNRRIKDTGWGWLNEQIERISVRPHCGNGFTNETKNVVWKSKNLKSNDDESRFIKAFQGRWGVEGDAPQSPYWNRTMKDREFDFN